MCGLRLLSDRLPTLGLIASLLLFLSVSPLGAQDDSALVANTDRIVGDIEIEFVDLVTVSREAILARVQIREGMPYSQQLVDRSIRSLYSTLLFDFIEARTEEMENNQVRIIFSVQSKYRIEDIVIQGASEISRNRLFRDFTSRVGGIIDERRLQSDADTMLELYQDRGYTEATIDFEIDRNPETGRGVVTFYIDEGPRLKIDRVEFLGNNAFSDRNLRGEMETRRRWWLSWLTGSGRFDEVVFQEDLERLRAFYIEEGYLDVSIPESNVTLEYPEPDEILITIRVDEGRQYSVGEVSFEGNELFESAVLYPILGLIPGDTFSPADLDEDIERLTNAYGSLGYLDAHIRADRRANVETGNIDLVYNISEGERFDVESIIIEGNVKTKSTVIIRELALQPGRNFNLVYMKNSEARLRNTRFFEDVQVTDEVTDIPGRRNLKIRVQEGRTGNFQFGAGFSSIERVVVFFEVSQSNFDFFKWRSPVLQGDGQKFRLRGSIGSRSNEVSLYFEEPWLFEQRLAAGFELFRRESDYNSATYDELRTGVEVFLRKRLIGLIDGQLSYNFQLVDLKNVSQNAPDLILSEAAQSPRTVSKVTMTLVRDTRNDLVFTSRGSRFSFATSFAGIGGSTEYMQFETRNSLFIPLFEPADQVLQIIARAGTFWSYGETDNAILLPGDQNIVIGYEGEVPFFDRYYLGGPNSLRGFEYREVGPIAGNRTSFGGFSNEPIGGNTYGFGSIEYTAKVAEPLRLALFYDWGFANEDDFDFNPRGFNDNWGLGIRLLVLGNPLRLDYGIPITASEYFDQDGNEIYSNDEGGQFNFSFGTRF